MTTRDLADADWKQRCDSPDAFMELLDSTFVLGNGNVVSWGEATVEQHQAQIDRLTTFAEEYQQEIDRLTKVVEDARKTIRRA